MSGVGISSESSPVKQVLTSVCLQQPDVPSVTIHQLLSLASCFLCTFHYHCVNPMQGCKISQNSFAAFIIYCLHFSLGVGVAESFGLTLLCCIFLTADVVGDSICFSYVLGCAVIQSHTLS